MEAFSLLKYWRGGGATVDGGANTHTASTGTTTIVTAVSHRAAETDEDDGDDDGPFFDLELTVPPGEDDGDEQPKHNDGDEDEDDVKSDAMDSEDEREFNLTLSSGESGDSADPNASLSPSDDLFFNGRLVPIEPSSIVFNSSESKTKSQCSLLKSATKFRVMMLKFKKIKANVAAKQEEKQEQSEPQKQKQNRPQSKFLTVKFKVEEVPIVSLFSRDNSSRASSGSQKQQNSDESASEEKKFSKDVMQRYLKMVKPLYVRVSKRYSSDKQRFSGQLSKGSSEGTKAGPSPPCNSPPAKSTVAKSESEPTEATEPPPPSNVKSQKQGNLPAGLRVVRKHLGKSRSASSAVAASSSSGSIQAKRHDDSFLQQQDGIQSAILHCKRSFKESKDSESSLLSRSVSDSSHDKSKNLSMKCSMKCSEELKETGI